ncbi:MAG: ABC transporter permease [Desulfurococcales archaeon]|nr:ABC transporter permease [Desulfurococcales archaeon]
MRRGILVKEVKELLRDKYILFNIIILPMLMVFVMGGIALIATQTSTEPLVEGEALAALVLEDPDDPYALRAAEVLGWRVYNSVEEALGESRVVIVVPKGFGDMLSRGEPGRVTVYARLDTISLAQLGAAGGALSAFEEAVRAIVASERGVKPELVINPLEADNVYIYKGREIGFLDLAYMVGLPLIAGFIAFILGSVVAQVGAISIAVEREARTVEILLSMPVSRAEIAVAKLVAVTIIGLLATISFEAGFLAYAYVVLTYTPAPSGPGGESLAGLLVRELVDYVAQRPFDIGILALSAFIAAANMALLGLIVGVAFVGDIRGATSSVGFLSIIVMAPVIYELFAPGAQVPLELKILFHASPIYYPFMIVKGYATGSWETLGAYMVVEALYLVLASLLAAKLMGGEAMIYGARQALRSLLRR